MGRMGVALRWLSCRQHGAAVYLALSVQPAYVGAAFSQRLKPCAFLDRLGSVRHGEIALPST
jgi:hypothetical protein